MVRCFKILDLVVSRFLSRETCLFSKMVVPGGGNRYCGVKKAITEVEGSESINCWFFRVVGNQVFDFRPGHSVGVLGRKNGNE